MKRYWVKYGALLVLFSLSIEFIQAQNNNPTLYKNLDIEQSHNYLSGNKYQKDLLLFFDMLKFTHPAFASNVSQPFNIDDACSTGYEWAKSCISPQYLQTYLQRIVSTLNDGHTALFIDFNNSGIYPFMFYEADDTYYLYTIARQYASFLGKQIIKINGYPIKEVIQSFRPLFSCDNEIDFKQKIKKQISFDVLWINSPYRRADSTLQLAFSDSTILNLKSQTVNNRDLVALQTKQSSSYVRQNSKNLFLYRIFEEEGICYLQFNLCEDQSSLRLSLMNDNRGLSPEQIEQVLLKYPRFDSFLSNMFETIAAKKSKTLVIDVRDNSGGNSSLCKVLLSWLKPIEEQIEGNSASRLSLFWEMCYPQVAKEYRKAFLQNKIDYQLGRMYDNKWLTDIVSSNTGNYNLYGIDFDKLLFVKNRDTGNVFKGNIVFIQNEGTYSSAGQLITDAIDNNIGIIVGSKSSFKPCNYGDILTWKLPNTSITGSISYKSFKRPDSSKCNETSMNPSFQVPHLWNDVLEGNDVYWMWILDKFGK